jgi:hypothetical protein
MSGQAKNGPPRHTKTQSPPDANTGKSNLFSLNQISPLYVPLSCLLRVWLFVLEKFL